MATGTAYYNLTKPASNENYNLATWNTNLDMIDAQMHQNETETFTGATSLANGTVGNVPAPLIADKDKYLKGDGTWDTPSGGGGSSTLDGLTDVNISSPTNGQALVYDATNQVWINGNVSGGGGGGSYTETILFDNQGGAAPATITLLDDYTNYDMLVFVLLRSADGRRYKYEVPYLVSSLNVGDSIQLVSYTEYASYDITNATTLTQVNANDMYLDTVVGISY